MPQVIFKAATPGALPSKQQFQAWRGAWSKEVAFAVWGQPAFHASLATMSVINLGVEQISQVIQPSIQAFNRTHRDETITVVVQADS